MLFSNDVTVYSYYYSNSLLLDICVPVQPHFGHIPAHHSSALTYASQQSISSKENAAFEQKWIDALMQVKAGKLSFDEAMAKIKAYEKQRIAAYDKKLKQVSWTHLHGRQTKPQSLLQGFLSLGSIFFCILTLNLN